MKPTLPLDRRIKDSVTDEVIRGLRRFLREFQDFLSRHIGRGGTDQHPVFTSTIAGFVPAPEDAPTTHVLQADGTWAAGGGGGGVPTSRTIATTAPLTGGGDLTADRTLAITSFSGGAPGAVPTSLGGTSNYLRADGGWSAPPGTGAPTSRLINTTAPLAGGGDLSADRTLSVATFGAGAAGVVPASGGGTVNFLRADGTWQPAGGGGGGLTLPQAAAIASLRP